MESDKQEGEGAKLPVVVAALYRFVSLPNYESLRQPLLDELNRHGVKGTLILAGEGINGTIAGSRGGIDAIKTYLRRFDEFIELEVKESACAVQPFRKSKVRLKREIVTMGVDGIDPRNAVGTYVDAENWNELISDPDVVLIDTRNEYEVAIGTFEGAENPKTESFREFPEFVDKHLDPQKHKKVAMFCTGGIRCEKSTALLKQKGFDEVYHLRGGILKYLETIPVSESKWRGDCFVFDQRVSVGHGVVEGEHIMCFACGWAVSKEDQQHRDYQAGVHCPQCVNALSEERKRRFAERQEMWKRQGHEHHRPGEA